MREWLIPVNIDAMHLDDAWWQLLRSCFKNGHEYKVTHGSYEFDYVTVLVRQPWMQIVPLVPEASSVPPPASEEQLQTYMADYLYTDFKSPNEDYRYGERIVNPKLRGVIRPLLSEPHSWRNLHAYRLDADGKDSGDECHVARPVPLAVNQLDEVVRKFAHAGGEGTNQCTIEIAMPNDILLNDPPCLRLIDCRIRYGKLHFIVYFRSWDLYAGFPVNMGGLELLKQLMVDELNSAGVPVDNGCLIASSKGLHIYEQYYELVESQLGLPLDQLRRG
jgi:thymidylate synthase